jgi:signal transduction histidine kinase
MNNLIKKLSSSFKGFEFNFEEVGIKGIIEETVSELKLERMNNLRFKNEMKEGRDFKVFGDRDALKKVFVNLLLNSLQSLPDGTGEIDIFSKADGENLLIEIKDSGCGISKEAMKDLFKPFKSTKSGGLGIGLYQCRSILSAHKGKIEVESREGMGAKFLITLPAIQTL